MFRGVEAVQIYTITRAHRLRKVELEGRGLQEVARCLEHTVEVPGERVDERLLSRTYLLQVWDRSGVRSLELYTATNLKGNRGRYYENTCIHESLCDQSGSPLPQGFPAFSPNPP